MRFVTILAASFVLLAAQVQAQTAAPAPAPAAPPAAMAPATPPATTATRPARAPRQTLDQRFAAANTTNDGHLTKDQATAANWTYVGTHFDAIDASHKGYITTADIRAYSKAARAARKAAKAKSTN